MEIGSLSTDQLEVELMRLEVLRRRIAALQAGLIGEVDWRQVPLLDGCRTTTEWVAGRLDLPHSEARGLVALAERAKQVPATMEALTAGEIGVARAELISRVAGPADENDWRERVRGHSLEGAHRLVTRHRPYAARRERQRHLESYVVVQPSLDESWWKLAGGLGGIAGKIVSETLKSRAEEMDRGAGSRPHRQALALEELCVDGPGDGPIARVTGFFDVDAHTADSAGSELAFGPRIGPDALGELLCTGTVRLVGLHDGKPILTSDASRTIPPAIRDYVTRRDGGCRAQGCTSKTRLQPHHVGGYARTKSHDPEDLLTLCFFHHHVIVHRRGMQVEHQPDGSIRFRLPADSRAPP